MSQEEQWVVVCKRCSKKYMLDSEPTEDFVCEICGPPREEPKFSKDRQYEIRITPKAWICGKHSLTLKSKEPCPDCEREAIPPLSVTLEQLRLEEGSEKIRDEIGIAKTEREVRNKIRAHNKALQQAQLDTPILLKQLIGKMDKLAKVMEASKNGS